LESGIRLGYPKSTGQNHAQLKGRGGGGFGRGTSALGIHGMDLDFRRDFRVQKRGGFRKIVWIFDD